MSASLEKLDSDTMRAVLEYLAVREPHVADITLAYINSNNGTFLLAVSQGKDPSSHESVLFTE